METHIFKIMKAVPEEKGVTSSHNSKRGGIAKFLWSLMTALILTGLVLSMPLGAQERGPERDPRQLQLAADLAAGMDIAVIIRNAVAAGLSVEQAIESLVTAGTEPGRVVYSAITAGFPAESVVKGAATAVTKMGLSAASFQATMTTIVSVALQAGATASQVNNGARSAGVPAGVIANANVQAAQSPAPVFGYTAPVTPTATTSSVIGGAVGSRGAGSNIGGAGVGAPPTEAATKPASPYKPE